PTPRRRRRRSRRAPPPTRRHPRRRGRSTTPRGSDLMRNAACKRALLLVATVAPLVALCPAPVHAQPAGAKPAAAEPDAAAVKKATAAFQKGDELFGKKKFALALEAFKESYAAVPSPNSHLYIARCLRELNDTKAAYAEFGKVIDEADAKKDK